MRRSRFIVRSAQGCSSRLTNSVSLFAALGSNVKSPFPWSENDVEPDCGYRIDLLVDGRVVIELKAVDSPAPVHEAIVLTYLRLSGRLHTAILKDGIQRLVNNYAD